MEMQRARPVMPGYGIDEGEDGLLDWAEVERRLTGSRNYWLATTRPDGRPHVMAVWAVWLDGTAWFSSSLGSRKVRNLQNNPLCTITTESAEHPVVVDGRAVIVTEPAAIERFLAATNRKYQAGLDIDFLDPHRNATVRIEPTWVFALDEEQFTRTPTRWRITP